MKRLADLNESLARVFSFGKTYENRTMFGIRVGNVKVSSLLLSGLRIHMLAVCCRYKLRIRFHEHLVFLKVPY